MMNSLQDGRSSLINNGNNITNNEKIACNAVSGLNPRDTALTPPY